MGNLSSANVAFHDVSASTNGADRPKDVSSTCWPMSFQIGPAWWSGQNSSTRILTQSPSENAASRSWVEYARNAKCVWVFNTPCTLFS